MLFRSPRNAEERASLYRLRYRVYVEELGRSVPEADEDLHQIVDPQDDGGEILIGAWADGEAIGTVRVNLSGESSLGAYAELYDLARFEAEHGAGTGMLSRLVVAPDWRKRTIAVRLILEAVRRTLEGGARWLFFHCRSHLVPMYLALGGVSLRQHEDGGPGPLTILRVDLDDLAHLSALNSPLARVVAEFQARPAAERVLEHAA